MTDPISLHSLLETWRDLEFEQFRDGIDVHHIKKGEPAVAILRYAPGATVPRHRHGGLETILVLEGVQSDEKGDYSAGSVILNPEDSVHSVWSDTGCAVLIQWERPVEILNTDEP